MSEPAVRVYVSEDTHKRVKKFAVEKGMTVRKAYDFLIRTLLDSDGKMKELIVVEEVR